MNAGLDVETVLKLLRVVLFIALLTGVYLYTFLYGKRNLKSK